MFQRELLIISAFAAAVFLTVAGTGWVVVWKLHVTSQWLVVDTLPGLVDAGQAGERIHDNRHTMREMLFPHTASERSQMIELVQTNTCETLWHDYATSIFEPEDRQNYQAMVLVRANYLKSCNQFFKLVQTGKIDEASALFYGELGREFQQYNDATKGLFDYNVKQGIDRSQAILKTTRYAPWIIAGLCVLIFTFGLALGLRSGLSSGK